MPDRNRFREAKSIPHILRKSSILIKHLEYIAFYPTIYDAADIM
jgi:hypothetical protein